MKFLYSTQHTLYPAPFQHAGATIIGTATLSSNYTEQTVNDWPIAIALLLILVGTGTLTVRYAIAVKKLAEISAQLEIYRTVNELRGNGSEELFIPAPPPKRKLNH